MGIVGLFDFLELERYIAFMDNAKAVYMAEYRHRPEVRRRSWWYTQKWRLKNPEKFLATQKKWEQSPKAKAQRLLYQQINREELSACRREHHRSPRGRYLSLLNTAKRREIECNLPFEVFCSVVAMPCDYCGTVVLSVTGCGLDRKDSDLGYTVENVVSCCPPCNRIKNALLNHAEMKFVMARLKEFRASQAVANGR